VLLVPAPQSRALGYHCALLHVGCVCRDIPSTASISFGERSCRGCIRGIIQNTRKLVACESDLVIEPLWSSKTARSTHQVKI
jgi:hypothetical protein